MDDLFTLLATAQGNGRRLVSALPLADRAANACLLQRVATTPWLRCTLAASLRC